MQIKKIRLIFVMVVLMMGLSITGWSISTHYDQTQIYDEFQKELKDNQVGNSKFNEVTNSRPILFLFSAGLIGLLGVRRQGNQIKSFRAENGAVK